MDLSKMDVLSITNAENGRMRTFDSEGEIADIETIIITIPTDDVITALVTAKDRVRRYILSNIDIHLVGKFGKVIGGEN